MDTFSVEEYFTHFDREDYLVEELIYDWEESNSDTILIESLSYWESSKSQIVSFPSFPFLLWRELCGDTPRRRGSSVTQANRRQQVRSIFDNAASKDLNSICILLLKDFLEEGHQDGQHNILAYLRDEIYYPKMMDCFEQDHKEYLKNAIAYFYLSQLIGETEERRIGRSQAGIIPGPTLIMEYKTLCEKDFVSRFERYYSQKVLNGAPFHLSEEQKEAVRYDGGNCLIRSSAGSGKTVVLIARFFYLVWVKGVPANTILFLAYTNEVCDDINRKIRLLLEEDDSSARYDSIWKVNPFNEEVTGPAKTFHKFAKSIICASISKPISFLMEVHKNWDKNETDHNRAVILLRDGEFKNDDAFKKSYIHCSSSYYDYLPDEYDSKKDDNEYVSFIRDRDNRPVSLRSSQEKWIYEHLVSKGIDVDYELVMDLGRPDFTIHVGKETIYYEHFAKEYGQFDDFDYGAQAELKKKEFEQRYPKHFFFTNGEGKTKNELLKELDAQLEAIQDELNLESLRTITDEDICRRVDFNDTKTNRIVERFIGFFLRIRDIVVDSCLDKDTVRKRIEFLGGFPAFFWYNIYCPLDKKYKELLHDEEHCYTDCSDCFDWAIDKIECLKRNGIPKQMYNDIQIEYQNILIDEYQDITRNRHRMLKSYSHLFPKMRITAVGDDWQSIYSFSNSDLSLYRDFEREWDGTSFELNETFRFGQRVCDITNAFVLDKIDNDRDYRQNTYLTNREVKSTSSHNTAIEKRAYERDNSDSYFDRRKNDEIKQLEIIKGIIVNEILNNAGSDRIDFAILSRFRHARTQDAPIRKELEKMGGCFYTMHSAKGITTDYCFIMNCNDNAIPFLKREDEIIARLRDNTKKVDEERRLFYVALTRAKKAVYMLYESGNTSPFVDEILKKL